MGGLAQGARGGMTGSQGSEQMAHTWFRGERKQMGNSSRSALAKGKTRTIEWRGHARVDLVSQETITPGDLEQDVGSISLVVKVACWDQKTKAGMKKEFSGTIPVRRWERL